MYKVYWNDQLMLRVTRSAYKNAKEAQLAFAKLFKVNPRYIRVEEIEVKEIG